MSVPESFPELTALFERLGARDPDSWARSQIHGRIPQLHRYLFLRQCWQHVIGEDSTCWVDYHIEQAEQNPRDSFAGMGAALKRAVTAGVAREDLSQIARGVQVELLSQLCYMLEDNGARVEGRWLGTFPDGRGREPPGANLFAARVRAGP